ncbi:MAG: hypothetical protein EKK63_02465 [Acinetobacter sp.]|uniref:hypothetical protein n=1 Tax=Acinetobacter sp. TaxID=472 RepID=UPI000F992A15|nr:hypothetical protein [Acinetobacter sp.]RUP42180.1 MAG: hypothetical protein EKK63_02465 [Acinetobacter sp.]
MTIQERIQEKLDGNFTVKSIENVNHKPHPFMLGPKHISFCADNYGGRLGEACIADRRFPTCSHPGCTLEYKDHTSDKVLFLQLQKNLEQSEAQKLLQSLEPLLKEDSIDGICFVETPEKFRIS